MSLYFVVLSWNSSVRHDVLEMVGTWSWFGDLGIWYSFHWEMIPFPMSSETYGYFFCSASLPCNTIQSIKQKSLNSEHLYLFLIQVTFCFPWDYCFPNILGKVALVFSRSAVSDSLWPHRLQHARLPCPSPSPGFAQTHVHWVSDAINHLILCHPFSSYPQSFLASVSFPPSQLFTSSGQSIGTSASASVLPMNIRVWFPLGLTGLISLQ